MRGGTKSKVAPQRPISTRNQSPAAQNARSQISAAGLPTARQAAAASLASGSGLRSVATTKTQPKASQESVTPSTTPAKGATKNETPKAKPSTAKAKIPASNQKANKNVSSIISALKDENYSSGEEFKPMEKSIRQTRNASKETPKSSPNLARGTRRSAAQVLPIIDSLTTDDESIQSFDDVESNTESKDTDTDSTETCGPRKSAKITFFGADVAVINDISELSDKTTLQTEERVSPSPEPVQRHQPRHGKYSSSPVRSRKSEKTYVKEETYEVKQEKEKLETVIVKKETNTVTENVETHSVELRQTRKKRKALLDDEQEQDGSVTEDANIFKTRKIKKDSSDSDISKFLDSFEKSAISNNEEESKDINIEKLSEEYKMLIEKQAESQAIIDALEKDNHEKADKISSLEKLYESLYKENESREQERTAFKTTKLEEDIKQLNEEKEKALKEFQELKDQKEKTSQELIKNLNELTTSLNWEREESKKKDEQINTLTNNHNDEIVDLRNQLDTFKKSNNSNELIKNLNEVTTSLNHKREEIKKKDEQINTLTNKHIAEIVELKNQLEASKKESFINLKDAEENKRKVAELETKVSDMMFQQTVADQDEMENIKKIQELKNQLTAEQAKNKTFGDNSENLEVLIKENERLNTNVRTLTEENKGLLEEAKKLKSDKTQEHDKNEVAELKQKLAKALDEKASAEKSLAEIKSKPQEDKSLPKPVDTSTADRLRRYDMLYDEGRRINDIFGREIVEKEKELNVEKDKYKKLLAIQTQIKNSIAGLSNKSTAAQVHAMSVKIGEIGSNFDNYETQFGQLTRTMSDVENRLGTVVNLVITAWAKVKEELNVTSEVIDKEMGKNPNSLNSLEKLVRVERFVDEIVTKCISSSQAYKADIEKMEKSKAVLEKCITRLKKQRQGIVDKAKEVLDAKESKIAELKAEIDGKNGKIALVEQDLEKSRAQVKELQCLISKNNVSDDEVIIVESLDSKQSESVQGTSNQPGRKRHPSKKEQLKETSGRVAELENKVITELKAEIVALKKSLDKEKRALSSMQSKKDSIINKQAMNIKNLEEKIAVKDKTIKDRAETVKESKQRGSDRVKEINLQLTQEKEKNVVKEAKINSLNETIKSNQEKIREKEEEIKKLKNNQDNTEKRDETNKDTTDNVATPHELNKLKVELEEKEKTIQLLNEKLETYNNLARNNREFLQLQNELKKKTNCIKDLESTIQQYKDKITELEGIIQSQESKYANMEENMKKNYETSQQAETGEIDFTISTLKMQVNNALSNTDKLTAQLNEVKAYNESTTESLAEKDRIIKNLNNELNVTQARAQQLSIDLNKADNNLKQAKLDMGNLKKEVYELKNGKKSEFNLTDNNKEIKKLQEENIKLTKANQETKLAYEAKILELTASLAAAQEENRTASELEDLLGKEEEKVKEKAERNLELIMQINDLIKDSNETKGRLTELDNLNAILKVKDEKNEESKQKLDEKEKEKNLLIQKVKELEKEKEISEKKMEEIQSVNDKYIEEKQERRKTLEALNLSLKQSQEQLEKLKHKFKKSKVQLKNISENSEKLTKKIIREKDQEIRDLNIMLNMKKDELNELNVKMKQSPCKTEIKEEKSQPKISQRPLDSCQGTSKDAKSIEVTKDAKSTDTAKAEKSPINHSEGSARKRESPSGEEQAAKKQKTTDTKPRLILTETEQLEMKRSLKKKMNKIKDCQACPGERMDCADCKQIIKKELARFERKTAPLIAVSWGVDKATICAHFRDILRQEYLFHSDQ